MKLLEAGEPTDEEHQWIGLKDWSKGWSIQEEGFQKTVPWNEIWSPKITERACLPSKSPGWSHQAPAISVSVRVSNGYQSSRSPRSTRSWKVLLKVSKSEQIMSLSTAFNRILCFKRWCPMVPPPRSPRQPSFWWGCMTSICFLFQRCQKRVHIQALVLWQILTMGRKSLGP